MTLQLAAHIAVTETDTGMALLDERRGRYWVLNGTGAVVLRTLLTGGDLDQAVAALRTEHPQASERIPADVAALVRTLRENRLVTP